MKNTKNKTHEVAFCGITRALMIVIMLIGFFLVIGTYAAPAIASAFLLPVVYEYGEKAGFTVYIAVSCLSLFLLTDYELIFMFIFLFGIDTVFKFRVDRIKSKPLRYILKFAFVNIALITAYALLLTVFPVKALVSEFSEYSTGFILLLMRLMNVTFFLYDKALERLLVIYVKKFRKHLMRNA